MNWAQTLFCVKNIVPNNFSIFMRTNLKTSKKHKRKKVKFLTSTWSQNCHHNNRNYFIIYGPKRATANCGTITIMSWWHHHGGEKKKVFTWLAEQSQLVLTRMLLPWERTVAPNHWFDLNSTWVLMSFIWKYWSPAEEKKEERKQTSEPTYAVILRYSVILPPPPTASFNWPLMLELSRL